MLDKKFGMPVLACLVSLLAARSAVAQVTPAEKAAAEALFDEGVRLMRAGAFSEACPKLETSERVDPAVGTLLYLGECYERTDRTASAWATFREAASMAKASGQAERAKTAQSRADRLEPGLAWLTIDVSNEARALSGLTIRRAGLTVDPALWGVATPVDTGDVLIEASAPGRAVFSNKMSIQPARRTVITIPALADAGGGQTAVAPSQPRADAATAPAVHDPAPPNPALAAEGPRSPTREGAAPIWPLALAGVGVVGLGVGSYFGLKAMSNASDAKELCEGGLCTEPRGEELMDDADDAATISNVAFGIGAAGLATALILYLTGPSSGEQAKVGLSPLLDSTTAGLTLRGRL